MNKIIQIIGPTGVGKSRIAVQLSGQLNGEIISADSVQVYRGFDIGSSKISESEKLGIKHHMIDIVEPSDPFNVNMFIRLSLDIIRDISERGKLPVVCGGTALYLRAMVNGIFEETDKKRITREKLKEICGKKGIRYLWERLERIDKDYAVKIGPNDKKRIIRGLEIYYNNRITPSNIPSVTTSQFSNFKFIRVGLELPRELTYSRINSRVDSMIEKGLIEEVRKLMQIYGENCIPMNSIGYKEINEMIKNDGDKEKAVDLIKQHSRNFAKRQMSWFRSKEDIAWFDPRDEQSIILYIKEKLDG